MLALYAKWAQNGGEKNPFCKLFVTKSMHRFTHFPAANFREILMQHVKRYRLQFFRYKIAKCFRQGVIYSNNLISITSFQPWPSGLEPICVLHLIVKAPKCVVIHWLFTVRSRKASFASAVCYGKSVRLSIYLSVCPHTPVLCQNEGTQKDAAFTNA